MAPGAGSPGVIGAAPDHAALPAMGGGVAPPVVENNDNIMSVGNVVAPQHYVTFLEALNSISPESFSYGGTGTPPAFSIDTGVEDAGTGAPLP